GNKWLRTYVRIAPFLVIGILVASIWGAFFLSIAVWLMIANLMATLGAGGKVSGIIGRADKAGALLGNYAEAIARIEAREWKAPRTRHLANPLTGSNKNISVIF